MRHQELHRHSLLENYRQLLFDLLQWTENRHCANFVRLHRRTCGDYIFNCYSWNYSVCRQQRHRIVGTDVNEAIYGTFDSTLPGPQIALTQGNLLLQVAITCDNKRLVRSTFSVLTPSNVEFLIYSP